ncbi:hypothetical protein [Streptomyces scopuliridis]|nr:hypothetical protein [Streptomyces scopuliridis]
MKTLAPTGKGRKRWTMSWESPLIALQPAFGGWLTPGQRLNLNNQEQPQN